MQSVFPSVSNIIASSTTDIASLANYVTAPVIVVAFIFVVVVAATVYFRRKILGAIKGVTRGGRRGRRRMR